ncbi:MAG: tetratricopeptide repeat protein [Flammeovirgaceae bacterium]
MKHFLIFGFLLLVYFPHLLLGQSLIDLKTQLNSAQTDAERLTLFAKIAALELEAGNVDESLQFGNQALSLPEASNNPELLITLSRAYESKRQFASALNYYLQVLKIYTNLKDKHHLAETNEEIGKLYKDWGVDEKAVEYLAPAYSGYVSLNDKAGQIRTLSDLVVAHQLLTNYSQALDYNYRLLAIYQAKDDKKRIINTLSNISGMHIQTNQPTKALANQKEILALNQELGDSSGVSTALNNLGFLYKRLQKYDSALQHFEESMNYTKDKNPVTLVNIGVMHQIMGNYEPSLLSFFDAAKIREQQQNEVEVARVCNYISAVYQTLDDSESALKYTERAIEFGKKSENKEVLATSYNAMSSIYQNMWRNKKALQYFKRYAAIQNEIQNEEKKRLQDELQKRVQAEKKENDLKLLLVDKEINQLSLKKLQLETEKKEQEFQLQIQEKELANAALRNKEELLKRQELEKEKSLQSLLIDKNRIEAEKRQQQLATLQATDSIQKLALKQKELEEAERQKDIELLKKEQAIQTERQEAERRFFLIGIGSFSVIAILLLLGYILKRRDNAKLEAQKKEIAAKNELANQQNLKLQEQRDEITVQAEELMQQRDEILAQRDYIEDKNIELEKKHEEIQKAYHSIQVLSDIGQEITATLDLSAIVYTVYKHVNEMMDATSFGIGMYNHEIDALEFTDFIEKDEVLPYSVDYLSQESLPSIQCFNNKKEIFINNLNDAYDTFSVSTEENRGEIPASLIYLPLTVEDRTIGVITVQSFTENAYTESDLALLHTLGSYASIALDNSRAYAQIKTANEQIKEKNKQITDSLRYALTIEEALLPHERFFSDNFSDYFVLFRPKDIVSGDFYWAHQENGVAILAAVDCTGHGVPGAFMSMVGNALFNQAVKERGIYDPAEILTSVNIGIKELFKHDSSETSEGMDICLCTFRAGENDQVEVTYAGAKRPLYFIKNGSLESLKADRISIGWPYKKLASKSLFHNQTLMLHKGDLIYMTTDGYADNYGRTKAKIGSANLKKLLYANHQLAMSKQKELLVNELVKQQGKREQRDDITLIGVKI